MRRSVLARIATVEPRGTRFARHADALARRRRATQRVMIARLTQQHETRIQRKFRSCGSRNVPGPLNDESPWWLLVTLCCPTLSLVSFDSNGDELSVDVTCSSAGDETSVLVAWRLTNGTGTDRRHRAARRVRGVGARTRLRRFAAGQTHELVAVAADNRSLVARALVSIGDGGLRDAANGHTPFVARSWGAAGPITDLSELVLVDLSLYQSEHETLIAGDLVAIDAEGFIVWHAPAPSGFETLDECASGSCPHSYVTTLGAAHELARLYNGAPTGALETIGTSGPASCRRGAGRGRLPAVLAPSATSTSGTASCLLKADDRSTSSI